MLLFRKSSVRTPLSPKVTHANTVLLRLYYKYIMLFFPFLHLKPSHISFLASLQIHGLLFFNCCYIHICMYLCIPKYNLLCLYGVTCIYVQKADHQILEKWLVYLSLEETTPTLSLPSYLQFFLQGWTSWAFPHAFTFQHVCYCYPRSTHVQGIMLSTLHRYSIYDIFKIKSFLF